jgi:hypothetical protein
VSETGNHTWDYQRAAATDVAMHEEPEDAGLSCAQLRCLFYKCLHLDQAQPSYYNLENPDTPLPQCTMHFADYLQIVETNWEMDDPYAAARLSLAQRIEEDGVDYQIFTALERDELDIRGSDEVEWETSRDYDSFIGFSSTLPYTGSIELALSGPSIGSLSASVHIWRKVSLSFFSSKVYLT